MTEADSLSVVVAQLRKLLPGWDIRADDLPNYGLRTVCFCSPQGIVVKMMVSDQMAHTGSPATLRKTLLAQIQRALRSYS
jgi:hypothetical protein